MLLEIRRGDLIQKTRSQSPARFARRLSYQPKLYTNINLNQLVNEGVLECYIPMGDYTCTIVFGYVLDEIIDELNRMESPTINLQLIIRALARAYDESDLLVACSCDDFKYRFDYWASKYGYKAGKLQTIPPKIRNPKDNQGATCKHLIALLNNKTWLTKVASVVNKYFTDNPDIVTMIFDYVDTNDDYDVIEDEELEDEFVDFDDYETIEDEEFDEDEEE